MVWFAPRMLIVVRLGLRRAAGRPAAARAARKLPRSGSKRRGALKTPMHDAFVAIGLLIVVGKLAEGVFNRVGLNSIIAYAATGIVLGPVLGVVEPSAYLNTVLGIGIFILFFVIGLEELDIAGFVAAIRWRLLVASLLSVLLSFLVALAVTSTTFFDFGLGLGGFSDAMAVAGVLSLSSLGLVAKVLADEGRLRDRVGIEMFTAVFVAELVALLVVGFTIHDEVAQPSVTSAAQLIAQVIGFVVVAWGLSRYVFPHLVALLRRFLDVPQLSFGLTLGGLFLMAHTAERFGLHGALGALLFGAALTGLPHQVRRDILPGIRSVGEGLFVPLFFASAGLHFGLSFADLAAPAIAALVIVPIVGKFVGAFAGTYAMRLENPMAVGAGLMAKGVAEIALLLVLLEQGVIGSGVFSLLVLVMCGYIVVTPPVLSFVVGRAKPSRAAPDNVPKFLANFALEGIVVGDLMSPSRRVPTPTVSVRDFADGWVVGHQDDYVVAEENGDAAGVVSLAMLRYLPKESWARTPLEKVMRREPPVTWPDEPAEDALQRMKESGLGALPVVERDSTRLAGVLTRQDVLEVIALEAKGHR